jgi:hypothetical protein
VLTKGWLDCKLALRSRCWLRDRCQFRRSVPAAGNLPTLEQCDFVYSPNVRVYSHASSTYFNSFPPAKVVHVNEWSAFCVVFKFSAVFGGESSPPFAFWEGFRQF